MTSEERDKFRPGTLVVLHNRSDAFPDVLVHPPIGIGVSRVVKTGTRAIVISHSSADYFNVIICDDSLFRGSVNRVSMSVVT